jgi:hypothetical protein
VVQSHLSPFLNLHVLQSLAKAYHEGFGLMQNYERAVDIWKEGSTRGFMSFF